MTYRQPLHKSVSNSESWLESLDDDFTSIRAEKMNLQVHNLCERGRTLLDSVENHRLPVHEVLNLIKELSYCDKVMENLRASSSWNFRTIETLRMVQGMGFAFEYPSFVQLHPDIWNAYEWNYHRTGRIIMHRHILGCLNQLDTSDQMDFKALSVEISSMRKASLALTHRMVDEVLSTVAQHLGIIDPNGLAIKDSPGKPIRRAIGAYFLLWPIKTIKSLEFATAAQTSASQEVFRQIRECTGMKSSLGDLSII